MFIEANMFRLRTKFNVWEVFKIALPLILAQAGHSLNLFTDRLMLQHYSADALAAAFPAGLTCFALGCYFFGTVGYAGSFVSQYYGANRPERIGRAVWHALYFAVIGGVYYAALGFCSPWIFDLFGHEARLRPLEITYFSILSWGGVIPLAVLALSCFWSGRGKSMYVLVVNLIITSCNIPFNYILIFGCDLFGIPPLGVAGAAYGTLLADGTGLLIYGIFFWGLRHNISTYKTWNFRFDWDLFKRIFRFGSPNGIQLFLDLASFNAFVILQGRISADVLNASGVAFSLNSLAMIPMLGMGQTASILVGQGVGAKDIESANMAVKCARFWLYSVLFIVGILFTFYPDPVLDLFNLEPGSHTRQLTTTMLYFITAYLLFDGSNILFGGAIKGAGDTRFPMWICTIYAWVLFALPCLCAFFFGQSDAMIDRLGKAAADKFTLWSQWYIMEFYIITLGTTIYLRFRSGKWKSMKVIEE